MRSKWNLVSVLLLAAATLFLSNSMAIAQGLDDGPVATVTIGPGGVNWEPKGSDYDSLILTVTGPDDFRFEQGYGAGSNPAFSLVNPDGKPRPNGPYQYELVRINNVDAQVLEILKTVTEENRYEVEQQLRAAGKLPEPLTQSGSFFISGGAIINNDFDEVSSDKDQVILDDLIVDGSICAGFDCVNGENFGFDTLRLKENNLRIKFDDTSSSASFPNNDWQLTANDTSNGGANKFSIDDITGGRTPFTVEAGARSNALYVENDGDVGFGTANPVVNHHIVDGNTPTIRLEQDGSSGFTAQTWDLASNEANFFIRDATNSSKLPFRIQPNAPSDSIFTENTGDIGLGTSSPNSDLHIRDTAAADNADLNIEANGQQWILRNNATTKSFIIYDNTGSNEELTIDTSGNVTALGNVCDGANNCLHTVGGGGATPWTTNGNDISYTSGNVGIGTYSKLRNGSWSSPGATGTAATGERFVFYDTSTAKTALGMHPQNGIWVQAHGASSQSAFSVWTEATGAATTPTEKFRVDFSGDVHIKNSAGSDLLFLDSPSGNLTIGGTLTQNSDVNAKENFRPVDGEDVLTQLAEIPITTWNFKADNPDIRHMGPMAQDFYASFGLGLNDHSIAPLDTTSVALAAIQALHQKLEEKDQQVIDLQTQNEALEARLEALEKMVETLIEK